QGNDDFVVVHVHRVDCWHWRWRSLPLRNRRLFCLPTSVQETNERYLDHWWQRRPIRHCQRSRVRHVQTLV
ncbi:unnamed protein product, partial [Aphanomyces euteiches]